jgi:hypothetical protein
MVNLGYSGPGSKSCVPKKNQIAYILFLPPIIIERERKGPKAPPNNFTHTKEYDINIIIKIQKCLLWLIEGCHLIDMINNGNA